MHAVRAVGEGAGCRVIVRVNARIAFFIAGRTGWRKGGLYDLGQFTQQHQLLTDVQVQSPCTAIDQLQLPGQQGQARPYRG